jgi:hypothetical protein
MVNNKTSLLPKAAAGQSARREFDRTNIGGIIHPSNL